MGSANLTHILHPHSVNIFTVGIPPGHYYMIEPALTLMENYGVLVGRTLAVPWSTRQEATLPGPLPPHLEEIVIGSHSSLGADGRAALTYILHKYSNVFPARGDPVRAPDRTRVCEGHVSRGIN